MQKGGRGGKGTSEDRVRQNRGGKSIVGTRVLLVWGKREERI